MARDVWDVGIGGLSENFILVIAGLDPAIPTTRAPCPPRRDRRVKPGDDEPNQLVGSQSSRCNNTTERNEMSDGKNEANNTHSPLDRRQFLGGAAGTAAALGSAASLLSPFGTTPAHAAAKIDSNDPVFGPLIEGAKKEGTVTITGNLLQKAEGRKGFADAMKEYYGLPTSFNVNWLVKGVGPTQKQIEDEVASNRVSVDVLMLNIVGWAESLAKRGKLLSFDAPEYKNFAHLEGKPMFLNRPYYVCDPGFLFAISWNADVIKDTQFTSWFDLLKPEFKGKISCQSARLTPSAAICFHGMKNSPEIGMDFFKRLAKQEVATIQLSEQGADKVVSGEFPICLGSGLRLYGYWQQGAKQVHMSIPKEGAVLLPNYWLGLANAPHPNAAKLVLNYVRTKESADLLMDREARMSSRTDVVSQNEEFVPTLQKHKWIDVDQTKLTQQDMRQLGEEWRDMFGA
jgi:iron(III) transport system substrate-binding protein